ncbi:LAQU0S10e01090g1_1 [Lachancea quebecensis]|uniref:LAQU0S10e01090g1_1 n=1 Tax=Lachancea quebecensis TaxID=1654605 RepID=A0A0P1KW34_9SACH|nr:LAQU0S10e01090g1_1 [Lachancea quebecensis]
MLPPINSLLQEHRGERSQSEPCSPFFSPARLNSFKLDDKGVIKLPPLLGQTPRQPCTPAPITRTLAPVQDLALIEMSTPRGSLKRAQSCSSVIESSPIFARRNVPETPDAPVTTKPAHTRAITPNSLAKTPAADHRKAFAFITHSQDTFPSKEPSIDNAPLARRKRRRTSKHELSILQSEFEVCATPDKQKRAELSKRCCMSEKAIQIWFQNKRQSVKRQQRATASDTLVPSMERAEAHTVTPLATRTLRPGHAFKQDPATPSSSILDTSNLVLESVPPSEAAYCSPTLSKQQSHQQLGRGQALTFRLKNDTKTLTPIRTSPNNRVNKLINGNKRPSASTGNTSPTRKSKCTFKAYQESHKRSALEEVNVNILRS